MRGKPTEVEGRRISARAGLRLALRVGGCFLSLLLATAVVPYVERWWPANNFLWVANGLFLAYLLLAPRWHWKYYFLAGLLAFSLRIAFVPALWKVIVLYNALDMVEIGVAALLLRPRSTILPCFTERGFLLRFLAYGVALGPALAGALFSGFVGIWPIDPQPHPFLNWMCSDSLGIATCTPAFVAVLRTRFRNGMGGWKLSIYPLLVFLATLLSFGQDRVPLMYLIFPLLVLAMVRMGLGYASLLTLMVTATAGWLTLHGHGPFAHLDSAVPGLAALNLQIVAVAALMLIYSGSFILESRDSIKNRLARIASIHALISENSRDAIMLADFHGHRSYASAAVERILGMPPEEFDRHKSLDLVHPEDLPKAITIVKELQRGADGASIECRVRKNTGEYIWVEASLRVVRAAGTGVPTGILNIVRDVTERKRAEQMRTFHHSVIRAIYDVSLEGILVVNAEGYVVSYNRRFAEIWKIGRSEIPEEKDGALMPAEHLLRLVTRQVADVEAYCVRVHELYANPDLIEESEIQLRDGRTLERYSTCVRDEAGQYLGRVWFFRDISEQKTAQDRLEDAYRAVEVLAATDAMTGLANRRLFDKVLSSEWRRALRERSPLSLLMIDADLFKSFNDSYGHMQGDECLKMIAEAASQVVRRSGDLVARFGGEEFTVILPNTEHEGAEAIAAQICEAVRARAVRHERNPTGVVTISVGCATIVPALGWHEVNLVELADAALYKAKGAGRNCICSDAQYSKDSELLQSHTTLCSAERSA